MNGILYLNDAYISLSGRFCLFHSASFVNSGVIGRSNSKISLTSADILTDDVLFCTQNEKSRPNDFNVLDLNATK